ncbi:RYamide receptor-like [Adelges cooleyi]|uniref:RYamide receptor-like n=1 Tax=Adelges cooleyi TaxID=133065 RepID=UPI002180861E|nr:RYamide receptor-like [Adelges cooleyi]
MIMPEVVNVSSIDEVSSWNVSDIVTDISCQMKPYEETLGSVVFKSIAFAIGMLVIVTALVGNGLVCIVITSSTQTISVINTLILNIAISDMIISLFYFPYLVNVIFMNYWPFGEALCCIYTYLNTLVIQVSTYTMVAISINRYVAVMWPLKTRASKHNVKSIIYLVWTLSAVTSFPYLIANGLQQPFVWYKKCDLYICNATFSNRKLKKLYIDTLGVLHTCIPTAVLLFTYISIGVVLWRQTTPGEAQNLRDLTIVRSKIKMTKIMLIVVLAFIICWLPFSILFNTTPYEPIVSMNTWDHRAPFCFMLYWLGMSHTCHNPIIYCCMNNEFRKELVRLLRKNPLLGRCLCRVNTSAAEAMPLQANHCQSDRSSSRGQPSSVATVPVDLPFRVF